MIRKPVVAGMFYPKEKKKITEQIKFFLKGDFTKKRVNGLISPHAGYIYSGSCAGKGFSSVILPDRVVILGVDHKGVGLKMSVDSNEEWETPLGKIKIDVEFVKSLTENSELFNKSDAGKLEHSIEVQVPFIQYINPEAKIVPVMVSTYDREELELAGDLLSTVIKKQKDDTLIIASTDMSHYISADEAKVEDFGVIEKIKELDPRGMLDLVISRRVSMCGVAPVFVMMRAVKSLGASKCEIVEYTNSGVASGNFSQVVGYLSAILF